MSSVCANSLLTVAIFAAASLSASSPFSSWATSRRKTRLLEIRVVLFPNTDERLESGLFLENDFGLFRRRSKNRAVP